MPISELQTFMIWCDTAGCTTEPVVVHAVARWNALHEKLPVGWTLGSPHHRQAIFGVSINCPLHGESDA